MDSACHNTLRVPTEFTNQFGCIQPGYVKFPTGIFDVLLASDLKVELKVYSFVIISYDLINFYASKKLQVQMCEERWAKRLGCARAAAYLQQKVLKKEKWFRIIRSKTNKKIKWFIEQIFMPA